MKTHKSLPKSTAAVFKYLEVNKLKFKYCRLCKVVVYSAYSV